MAGDQFTSGFVGVNPNSKIPAAVDLSGPNGQPVNLFESGSIVLYFVQMPGRRIQKSYIYIYNSLDPPPRPPHEEIDS